jgi:hypothetical protein
MFHINLKQHKLPKVQYQIEAPQTAQFSVSIEALQTAQYSVPI